MSSEPKRQLIPLSDKPYNNLNHKEAVDRNLASVLSHGYEVSYSGLDVIYHEGENALEYRAQKPLEDTIKLTGKRNPGYPDPWDTLRATKEDPTPCACGKIIGKMAECSKTNWCRVRCDCPQRLGRDLVHQCAIAGCKVRTCNSMNCPLEHYQSAHTFPTIA